MVNRGSTAENRITLDVPSLRTMLKTHFNDVVRVKKHHQKMHRKYLTYLDNPRKISLCRLFRMKRQRAKEGLAKLAANQIQFIPPSHFTLLDNIVDEFCARVRENMDVEAIAEKWQDMTQADQDATLKSCNKILAKVQRENSGLSVRQGNIIWFYRDETYIGRASSRVMDGNGLFDNIRIKANLSFSETINTLAHEQTHIFQTWLARAYSRRQIKPDHPLYQAALFHYQSKKLRGLFGNKEDAYIRCLTYGEEAYKAQFCEQEAWYVGDAVAKRLLETTLPTSSPA